VSITDPDARIMKTSDGGFEPSYKMQVVTDSHIGFIADVRVPQGVNDKFQLLAGNGGLESRCQQRPKEQDQYVCPAGKLLVFSKANKLPHGGKDRFYEAIRADCGPCENRERCCPHYTTRGRIITHRIEPAAVTKFKTKMRTRGQGCL
jgi:hypothetical protein